MRRLVVCILNREAHKCFKGEYISVSAEKSGGMRYGLCGCILKTQDLATRIESHIWRLSSFSKSANSLCNPSTSSQVLNHRSPNHRSIPGAEQAIYGRNVYQATEHWVQLAPTVTSSIHALYNASGIRVYPGGYCTFSLSPTFLVISPIDTSM